MTKYFFIFSFTVFLILCSFNKVYAFIDDFNGNGIDIYKWDISTNSGTITLTGSSVIFQNLNGKSFPYVRTKEGVIGNQDTVIQVDFKYITPGNFGDGISITDNLPPNSTVLSPNHKNFIQILVWQDGPGGLRVYTTLCPEFNPSCNRSLSLVKTYDKPDTKIHTIRSEYMVQTGTISIFFDDVRIFVSSPGQLKPKHVWLGTPEYTNSTDKWSTLEILGVNSTVLHPQAPTPIVIIPGFGASWNYPAILTNSSGGEWSIPSWINTYDNLIDSLHNAGYQSGTNLFVYTYDWRKSLDVQADNLNTYLADLVLQGKINPDTRLNFIAHSFGGLVSRAYLDKYGTTHLNKLVTAGSPHFGAAAAYKTWSGGQVQLGNWWQKSALSILLGLNIANGESPVAAIKRLSPSIENILPTYDFLQDQNGTTKPLSEMISTNSTLSELNSRISSINASTSAISGNNVGTLEKIVYGESNWFDRVLGKWVDGKPISDITTIAGDGTVTGTSAKGQFGDIIQTDLNHGDLVFDSAGIATIFQKLSLDVSKIIATRSAQAGSNPIVALLRSPGSLKMLSPSGVLLGMGETSTNSAVVIPEEKIIIIPQPEPGEYQIKVVSTGDNGNYSLYAGQTNSEGLELKRVDAYLDDQDTDTFTVDYVSKISTLETVTDPDFEEIILEQIERIYPAIESSTTNANRLQNLKIYLSKQLTGYSTKSASIKRNILFDSLNQLSATTNSTIFSKANIAILENITNQLILQVDKSVPNEPVSLNLYDLLYQKNATAEAKLYQSQISTASSLFIEPIISAIIPLSTMSANLSRDISNLFLKSIFLH